MSKKSTTANKATTAQIAAVLGFIAKATGDEFNRDDSPDGSHHSIRVSVLAEIDGEAIISREYDGTTDTGHASVRASSVGAKAGEVLAYVASKMNAATREALYRELADVFAANGGTLPVTEESVKEADAALARLRQKTEQQVRGTFKVTARRVDVDSTGKQVAASSSSVVPDSEPTDAKAKPAIAPAAKKSTRKS
jgi:hypothetical protein